MSKVRICGYDDKHEINMLEIVITPIIHHGLFLIIMFFKPFEINKLSITNRTKKIIFVFRFSFKNSIN